MEGASSLYIHPDIEKKLLQMKDGVDLSIHMDGMLSFLHCFPYVLILSYR